MVLYTTLYLMIELVRSSKITATRNFLMSSPQTPLLQLFLFLKYLTFVLTFKCEMKRKLF